MYKAWPCIAKTWQAHITSHVCPLFNEADYRPVFLSRSLMSLGEQVRRGDVTEAFEEGDFLKFIAAMMRYDKSHPLGSKPKGIKAAKHEWIDDLFVAKLGMEESEASAIRYLFTRRDENDRMRLHVAIMLFYRRHSLLGDDSRRSYKDLLASVDRKRFSEEKLCELLQGLFDDGLQVPEAVEYVYDQHVGQTIQNPENPEEELTFAEVGAKVCHVPKLPAPLKLVMEPFANAYIERSRNISRAKKKPKKPKKEKEAREKEAREKEEKEAREKEKPERPKDNKKRPRADDDETRRVRPAQHA